MIPRDKRFDIKMRSMYRGQVTRSRARGHNPPAYTKEEFCDWLRWETNYEALWNTWMESSWDSDLAPSVDRIDKRKSYVMGNIQLMTWHQNRAKGHIENKSSHERGVIQYLKGVEVGRHRSTTQAAIAIGCKDRQPNIRACAAGNLNSAYGFNWEFEDDYAG